MRVIIANEETHADNPLRQLVLNSGLECAADDCVTHEQLASRLVAAPADLLLVVVGANMASAEAAINNSARHTKAPIWAIGTNTDATQVLHILRCGASEYLNINQLRQDLLGALDKLSRT